MRKKMATTRVFFNQDGEDRETDMITAVHSDIILNEIFTRLDGPALASASCASSHLRLISNHQSLWSDVCHATWPSTNTPSIHRIISDYPNGPRAFFSDSFTVLGRPRQLPSTPVQAPPELIISAVDVYYKNNCIFSKVMETETLTSWFRCSPFRIDLLDLKDSIPTPVPLENFTCKDLEEDLSVSWIVVDPTTENRGKRAANVSSRKAVSVHRHWLSGEIQLRFATIMCGAVDGRGSELVRCSVMVTCEAGKEEETERRIQVREVSLQFADMDGSSLNGKESLEILLKGVRFGERRRSGGRESHEEFLKTKKEREEKKLRREGMLDSMCKVFGLLVLVTSVCSFSLSIW